MSSRLFPIASIYLSISPKQSQDKRRTSVQNLFCQKTLKLQNVAAEVNDCLFAWDVASLAVAPISFRGNIKEKNSKKNKKNICGPTHRSSFFFFLYNNSVKT